jgi:drug/metabolite transporter (DMT)-like permease
MRTIPYTTLALVAFSANSVLCRVALREGTIDAATFSTVRLTAGAAALLMITTWTQGRAWNAGGSWTSAGALFLYAVPFSLAYTRLTTGTGALILFGCVQVTMTIAALWTGERPHVVQWLGLGLALAGLLYLVLPGLEAPPFAGAALMAVAGCSWAVYSLRGRGAVSPLTQTTSNFVRSVPLAFAVSLVTRPQFQAHAKGLVLAVASGAFASGMGYVMWYRALRGLTATSAAVVQLAVPILAAGGGVIFLGEAISARLALSAVMILGGIALALVGPRMLSGRAGAR